MINNASFQIIGRIGKINAHDKVTNLSLASDRSVKKDDGSWDTETDWNSVSIFSEALRKRLDNGQVGKKGNLVIVQGNIQSGSYQKNGETIYTTNLIVRDFNVLSFVQDDEK